MPVLGGDDTPYLQERSFSQSCKVVCVVFKKTRRGCERTYLRTHDRARREGSEVACRGLFAYFCLLLRPTEIDSGKHGHIFVGRKGRRAMYLVSTGTNGVFCGGVAGVKAVLWFGSRLQAAQRRHASNEYYCGQGAE